MFRWDLFPSYFLTNEAGLGLLAFQCKSKTKPTEMSVQVREAIVQLKKWICRRERLPKRKALTRRETPQSIPYYLSRWRQYCSMGTYGCQFIEVVTATGQILRCTGVYSLLSLSQILQNIVFHSAKKKKAYRTSDHRASKGKEMKYVSFAKSVPWSQPNRACFSVINHKLNAERLIGKQQQKVAAIKACISREKWCPINSEI